MGAGRQSAGDVRAGWPTRSRATWPAIGSSRIAAGIAAVTCASVRIPALTLTLTMVLAMAPASGQTQPPATQVASEVQSCPPGQAGLAIRPATYVAIGNRLLFRLQVERSVDDALLIVNKVDGNRLYDRAYWKPVSHSITCGERSIEYVDEADLRPDASRLRLLLKPADEQRRPGLPRPLIVIPAEVTLPGSVTQGLQFEEVVIKREIWGAGKTKK